LEHDLRNEGYFIARLEFVLGNAHEGLNGYGLSIFFSVFVEYSTHDAIERRTKLLREFSFFIYLFAHCSVVLFVEV
jgi:hypothetical protein